MDDPAMDCGGDCLTCVLEAEGGIPSGRATLGLMSKTTSGLVLTDAQAAQINALTRKDES